MFFGRTDLRIGVSEAKFDGKADFDVHLPVALQKPFKFCEKLTKHRTTFANKNFWAVEKSNVGDRLKRILTKIRGCADGF